MSSVAQQPAMLAAWNELPVEAAVMEVLPCNGSWAWAQALAAARPYLQTQALFWTADAVWRELPAKAWQEAFDSHPRLGEAHAKSATARSLTWSTAEGGAALAAAEAQAALAEANRAYEARFGRIFLVCATGKSAEGILALLQQRMGNSEEAERQEAAEQQRRITQLRLRKWLDLPAVACEDV